MDGGFVRIVVEVHVVVEAEVNRTGQGGSN
jgi:hypothetical protein